MSGLRNYISRNFKLIRNEYVKYCNTANMTRQEIDLEIIRRAEIKYNSLCEIKKLYYSSDSVDSVF